MNYTTTFKVLRSGNVMVTNEIEGYISDFKTSFIIPISHVSESERKYLLEHNELTYKWKNYVLISNPIESKSNEG